MQGSGQPGPALHERFARAIAKTVMAPGFVIARPRRGRANLAVPCRISGKPRRKRDRLREIATSAVGLLAMTNLGAIAFLTLARTSRRCSAGSGCPLPYNTACGRRWLVRAATAFPRLPRRFAPRNDTSGSAAVHQCPPAVEWLCTRRSLTAATVKFGSACGRRWFVRAVSAFPRLHPKGTSSRFALRAPRRPAASSQ